MWRSIVDDQEVLKLGLIRRIGTGQSTWIWETNWLPRDHLLRPIRSDRPNSPVWVSDLIDEGLVSWNREILQEFFTLFDAETILNIPLSTRRQNDFWAWHFEKTGIFSVRLAYRMLVARREMEVNCRDNVAGRSNLKEVEKEWSTLWQVRVPSKIRVFLWRLAKHSLPSADVLFHRNMATCDACSLCGVQDSWRHSLVDCNMTRCVWALVPEEVTEQLCEFQEPEARGWLASVTGKLSHFDCTWVVVTLWAIWYARRKAIHEGIFQSPLLTYMLSRALSRTWTWHVQNTTSRQEGRCRSPRSDGLC